MTGPRLGPYSPAVRAGRWVVTSGQIGVEPAADGTLSLVGGGTGAQLRQALSNLRDVLASEGAGLRDVVKATIFLVEVDELGEVNAIWTEMFGDARPARSALGVAALPLGARVEVEAWALVPPADPR